MREAHNARMLLEELRSRLPQAKAELDDDDTPPWFIDLVVGEVRWCLQLYHGEAWLHAINRPGSPTKLDGGTNDWFGLASRVVALLEEQTEPNEGYHHLFAFNGAAEPTLASSLITIGDPRAKPSDEYPWLGRHGQLRRCERCGAPLW